MAMLVGLGNHAQLQQVRLELEWVERPWNPEGSSGQVWGQSHTQMAVLGKYQQGDWWNHPGLGTGSQHRTRQLIAWSMVLLRCNPIKLVKIYACAHGVHPITIKLVHS